MSGIFTARGFAVVAACSTYVVGALGCTGNLIETSNTIDLGGVHRAGAGGSTGGPGNGGQGGVGVGGSDGNAGDGNSIMDVCGDQEPVPGPMPRLTRLTHTQYRNSVQDLLGIEVTQTADFTEDATYAGFDNNAAALNVGPLLVNDYQRAAEDLAARVVEDSAAFARLVPCNVATADDACAATLIRSLTRRAYRRPLTTDEEASHLALYHRGKTLGDGPAFRNGVQLVIEAMLQSPLFLYRVELSDTVDGEQLIPLTGYEIASRLSFMLWNTVPDEDLLTAAESGVLSMPTGIETQARRLLNDPKAAATVDDFHRQWLAYEHYDGLTKSSSLHPDWNPEIGHALVEETQRFIQHVVLELESTYAELMTAPYAFVNRDLAAIYGVNGSFTDTLTQAPVMLAADQRAGLLTKAGFLASHAYPNQDSPIHRGVFMQRHFLCMQLSPPTFQIDPNLPALSDTIRTTRAQVEAHTAAPACQECHSQINPAGFAFSHYDATGAYRTTENGAPVDSSGSLLLDGRLQSFTNAVDLAHMLAESDQGPRCYLTQWFQYGNGRALSRVDDCTLEHLHTQLKASGYNIKELLVGLTQTRTFRYRAVEEVSP